MTARRIHIGWVLAGLAVSALALAGCGGSGTPAAAEGAQLGTRSITGVGAVLVAPGGRTLYHLSTEKNGTIMCTGTCAATWPPLVATSGTLPAAAASLTGQLGTVMRPDGQQQVTFAGMPLYTYSGDSAAGQANGQGIGGVWFAVAPSGSGAATPSDAGSGSGSGYGGRYGG
jgi:predicted lipoprotein with Yx(FWY)xxD motif